MNVYFILKLREGICFLLLSTESMRLPELSLICQLLFIIFHSLLVLVIVSPVVWVYNT